MTSKFKWYWRMFPWLMYDYMKAKSEQLVKNQKEIAQKVVEEAEKKVKVITKGNFLVQPECVTEFCFEAKNGRNFKFVDEKNIPAFRAMAAMDIYTMVEEKVDTNYHKLAYKSIFDAANKGNLIKVGQVAENALQRMNHITNIDLLYRLASVLYFDEHENPYEYNIEYAEKKIALWREEDLGSFFCRTPLKEYLPSFAGYTMSLETYTDHERKELLQHLTSHLSLLSNDHSNSELKTYTLSEIKKLNQLILSKS